MKLRFPLHHIRHARYPASGDRESVPTFAATRRKFLTLLGLAPAAVPAIAQQVIAPQPATAWFGSRQIVGIRPLAEGFHGGFRVPREYVEPLEQVLKGETTFSFRKFAIAGPSRALAGASTWTNGDWGVLQQMAEHGLFDIDDRELGEAA